MEFLPKLVNVLLSKVYVSKVLKGIIECGKKREQASFIAIQDKGAIPEDAPDSLKINKDDESRALFALACTCEAKNSVEFAEAWFKHAIEKTTSSAKPEVLGELMASALEIGRKVLSDSVDEDVFGEVITLLTKVYDKKMIQRCTLRTNKGTYEGMCIKFKSGKNCIFAINNIARLHLDRALKRMGI